MKRMFVNSEIKTMHQPLAFFWDIENCQVPMSKSTLAIVQRLREKFGKNYAEMEFIVVCDVKKERIDVVEELNAAQVTLIHVDALAKNACDDKLRTSMTKFGMVYHSPGTVVLISSDVNFTQVLTDLRYRCGFQIILIHNDQVSKTLLATANEHFEWQNDILDFVADQPISKAAYSKWYKLIVSNLPHVEEHKIRDRLKRLSDNCGGRVLSVNHFSNTAIMGFSSLESASRALKRIHLADVYGKRISVQLANNEGTECSANVIGFSPTATGWLSHLGRNFPASVSPTSENRAVSSGGFIGPSSSSTQPQFSDSDDPDIVEFENLTASGTANSKEMRDYSEETERLKRVLGFASDRTVSSSTNATNTDDTFDFTPVKESATSIKASNAIYIAKSLSEKTGQTSVSKLRHFERFAKEAVELLRASPHCRIPFLRFSSQWAKHFNRPLRLIDFGCAKLVELLENVNDALAMVEEPLTTTTWVTLTPPLLWQALHDQIVSILSQQPFRRAQIDNLFELYQATFGYELDLNLFGFGTLDEVLSRMEGSVEIEIAEDGTRYANLVEFRHRQMLANQLLYMFIRCPERRLASWQLENEFRMEFGIHVSINDIKTYLSDFIQVIEYDSDSVFVELNPKQRIALRVRNILVVNGGELPLMELEQIYQKQYGERFSSLDNNGTNKSAIGILRTTSHVLYLKGRGANNCVVCINRNFLSSLKSLKPDLFIPAESSKVNKKGKMQGSRCRSLSRGSNNGKYTYEMPIGRISGNSPCRYVQSKTIPIAKSYRHDAKLFGVYKQSPVEDHTVYCIAAASTPPEKGEFAKTYLLRSPCSKPNTLVAGSGNLSITKGFDIGITDKMDLLSPVGSTNSSPSRRHSRLAANFEALSKLIEK